MSPITILLLLKLVAVSTTFKIALPQPVIVQLKLDRCVQSPPYSPFSGCNRAIDGKSNQNSKFCSRIHGVNAWWSARTECKAHFKKIRLYYARDRHQLQKFDILVDGKVCASRLSSTNFSDEEFDCDQVGQEITIRSRSECLVLCEIQAFGELIRRPAKKQCSIDSAGQCFEPGKLLLFTISAGANVSALAEYRNTNSTHTAAGDPLPSIYRSKYLNDLPGAINSFGADRIVVEMRKDDSVAVQAVFNITDSDGLTSENWFSSSRLVSSSPYWIGNMSFLYFSISGFEDASIPVLRSFYVQFSHGGCNADFGFMGIGESKSDACPWVTNGLTGGQAPVLFYSTHPGVNYAKYVLYADQFLIYMTCNEPGDSNDPHDFK